ncbi:hypothetical protein P8452_16606 [Trifolium repens]|nr:hypothetical protein P8452_16606 [Trifolium repens]
MFWQFYGGVFWILIVGVEMGGDEIILNSSSSSLSPCYVSVAVFTAKTGIAHGCNIKSLNISNDTLEFLVHHTEDYLNLLPTFHNLTHLYVHVTGELTTTSRVLPNILRKTPKLEVLHIPTVVREYLDGSEACAIKLFPSNTESYDDESFDDESSDDESDDDEAANSGVFPAAGVFFCWFCR